MVRGEVQTTPIILVRFDVGRYQHVPRWAEDAAGFQQLELRRGAKLQVCCAVIRNVDPRTVENVLPVGAARFRAAFEKVHVWLVNNDPAAAQQLVLRTENPLTQNSAILLRGLED